MKHEVILYSFSLTPLSQGVDAHNMGTSASLRCL
jgi:hypothetical protein